jgi:hypothetical protein
MMPERLRKLVKTGELNFICPFGLGDTMRLNAWRGVLEKKYALPIHFIIKPSHKIVMQMYDNANYSICDFTDAELAGFSQCDTVPHKDELYIAHPVYSDHSGLLQDWFHSVYAVDMLFARFLRLECERTVLPPVNYPRLNISVPDIENAVLLLPEARSVRPLKHKHWRRLAARLRRQGHTIFQSYRNKEFEIKGADVLPDDMEQIVAFALSCGKVYSLRSGLCDLIAYKARDITIFYPDIISYKAYLLHGANIKNIIVRDVWTEIKRHLKKLPWVKQLYDTIRDRYYRHDEPNNAIEGILQNAS